MSTQPFDPVRYKAGQRREWDTAVPRLKKYWGQVAEPDLQPVSDCMIDLTDIRLEPLMGGN